VRASSRSPNSTCSASLGLHRHPDQQRETAAHVALWVLTEVTTSGWLPPDARATVETAIRGGAATDPLTAATMATWCHATAVRAAWSREDHPSLPFADLLVRAFERPAEIGGPDVPEHSTRLITLAGCHELRMRHRPDGDPGLLVDLQAAVDLVERGLAAEPVKPDMRLRGLRLQGQTALMAGRLYVDATWFDTAALAFRAALELADASDPREADDRELLEAALAERPRS
jgi:hypothetical protein